MACFVKDTKNSVLILFSCPRFSGLREAGRKKEGRKKSLVEWKEFSFLMY
jgi:hypothetical protein